jgi:hypothetical protein
MLRLTLFLFFVAAIFLGVGIKFQNTKYRQIGVVVIIAALALLLFGRSLDISFMPKTPPQSTKTPALEE